MEALSRNASNFEFDFAAFIPYNPALTGRIFLCYCHIFAEGAYLSVDINTVN